VTFKEVRLSPKIGSGDFETKVHRAIEFLEEGDRIKVTVRFRGRELTHPDIGRNLIAKFVERVGEHGVQERAPLLEGKAMHITMASTHKPKVHEAPRADRAAGSPAGDGANGQAAPAAEPETETPKAAAPKAEAPKAEAPKAEAPKAEQKSEPPAAQPASTAATPAAATGE
jgi:translation initiation factor IF-3